MSKRLIYAEDAIDALADMHCKSDEDGYVWIVRSDAWARIDALPSAQPEIIRCKDCKHRPFDSEETQGFGVEFPDEKCPCQCGDGWYNWRPNNEWFCANAEKRSADGQVRRMKVCEYCHEDADGYVRPIEKNSHAWLVRRGRTMILRIDLKGEYRECDISFCPMCGRRLKTDG